MDKRLQAARSAFIHSHTESAYETDSTETANHTNTEEETIPKTSANPISPKPISDVERNWLEGQKTDIINSLNHTKVTLADYKEALNLKLSPEDYNLIFFQGGQYKINVWEDEKIDLSNIGNLIGDRRKEKNKNIFDSEATETQKNEISMISEKEEKAEKEYTDLDNKITDINTRINYYKNLPKATLAQLISNDFQLMALIAFYYGYSSDVIIYYYAKSIEYALEYISFEEVADDIVKQKLLWIAARYDDIAFTCRGTEEAKWASKLSAAYNNLSSEY